MAQVSRHLPDEHVAGNPLLFRWSGLREPEKVKHCQNDDDQTDYVDDVVHGVLPKVHFHVDREETPANGVPRR